MICFFNNPEINVTHELRFEDFSFRHVTLAYVTREFAMSTALDSNGHYSHRKVNNSITQLTIILMDNKLNQKKTALRIQEFSLELGDVPTDLRSSWVST